jgi:alcohol dehydrogenase class IV
MPTKIVHGPGSLTQLGQLCKGLGKKKALLVTDPGVKDAGLLDEAVSVLKTAEMEFTLFDRVNQDAGSKMIDEAARIAVEKKCDMVIAFGGGSTLVAGKGIALVVANGGSIVDYEGIKTLNKPPLAVIAVPTTAGTGSEVSKMIPALDEERKHKLSIGGEANYPQIALLDPLLLRTLDQRQMILTSIDGLSHAIEGYLTNLTTPITDATALYSIELYSKYLRQAVYSDNIEAREKVLIASSLANMACGNSRLGLAHAMAQPLSGLCGVPHGVAIAIMLPYVIDFNLPAAYDRFARIGKSWGIEEAINTEDCAVKAAKSINEFIRSFNIPKSLKEVGIHEGIIPELANRCVFGIDHVLSEEKIDERTLIKSPNIRSASVKEVIRLYEQAL